MQSPAVVVVVVVAAVAVVVAVAAAVVPLNCTAQQLKINQHHRRHHLQH